MGIVFPAANPDRLSAPGVVDAAFARQASLPIGPSGVTPDATGVEMHPKYGRTLGHLARTTLPPPLLGWAPQTHPTETLPPPPLAPPGAGQITPFIPNHP